MIKITAEDFIAARDDYEGWCDICEEFTRSMVEPDAEDYPCPKCGHRRVVGAEQALIRGLFEVGEEDV